MKFNQYINEVFDNPVQWKIEQNTDKLYSATFEIDGNKYIFYADKNKYEIGDNIPIWEIIFYLLSSSKNLKLRFEINIVGLGNEFQVFATVIDIMKEFIRTKNPEKFKFTAKESSKIKLYNRFAKLMQSKFGYTLETKMQGIIKNYIFIKKA